MSAFGARSRPSLRLLYTAADGREYLVYDVVSVEGKGKRVPLGSFGASHRIFQPPTGAKQAYRFSDGSSHEISESTLGEQLSRAGWIGKHLYRGPGSGDPR